MTSAAESWSYLSDGGKGLWDIRADYHNHQLDELYAHQMREYLRKYPQHGNQGTLLDYLKMLFHSIVG
jgi:hypothetical protein